MKRDLFTHKTLPSSRQLLARVLEMPDLARGVRHLPAPALARLIDAVGLEDAGEIVAFASAEQLADMFDQDLFRSERPGDDERFDADRFLVWLEVMMEAGDAFVAERLAALPEDLVALALHEHVLVLKVDDMLAEVREMDEDDADAVEKALSNCLSEEVDAYQLVARRHEGWYTVLGAVLALDRDHHAILARILERLAAMTAEHVDREGGLHEALTSEEMLEADVSAEREDRRARAGYVAPSDARAFLALARRAIAELPKEHDPVTRAYFRSLAKSPGPTPRAPAEPSISGEQLARGGGGEEPSALAAVLVEAGVVPAPARPDLLLGAGPSRELLLARTMRALAEIDAAAFAARSEEIAYLANVLVAGASIDGRPYRPGEAVQKAVEITSRGLEIAATQGDPVAILREHPAEGLFRLAWSSEA